MCGRFRLTSSAEIVAAMFDISIPTAVANQEEFFPTNTVSVLRLDEQTGMRELSLLRWGLIPRWAKEATNFFNARAETLREKASFREPFRRRRCLIPADGFFEWPLVEGKKRKTLVQRTDQRPFAFAGLWERWEPKAAAGAIESCTIITSEPNDFMRPIHRRMPVILAEPHFEQWLACDSNPEDLQDHLLRPAQWPDMEAL